MHFGKHNYNQKNLGGGERQIWFFVCDDDDTMLQVQNFFSG